MPLFKNFVHEYNFIHAYNFTCAYSPLPPLPVCLPLPFIFCLPCTIPAQLRVLLLKPTGSAYDDLLGLGRLSISQQPSDASGSLAGGWDLMSPSPTHTWSFADLISCCRSCTHSHSYYLFVCARHCHVQQTVSGCQCPFPPALTVFLPTHPLLPQWSLRLRGGVYELSHLKQRGPQFLICRPLF